MHFSAGRCKKLLSVWLVVFLVAATTILVRIVVFGGFHPQVTFRDFANVYCGQELVSRGINPYETAHARKLWAGVAADTTLKNSYRPGLPEFPILYPPWALSQLQFLHFFPFRAGVWIWFVLLLVFLGITLLCAYWLLVAGTTKIHRLCALYVVVLCIIAFKGTVPALMVGQPFLFFWALLMVGVVLLQNGLMIPAGIFIGLGAGKTTLCIPLIITLVATGKWKTVATAILTILLFTLLFFLQVPEPVAVPVSFQQTVQEFYAWLFCPENMNYPFYPVTNGIGATQLTEIGSIIRLFDAHAYRYTRYLYLVIWIAAALFYSANQRIINKRPVLQTAYWCCCLYLTSYSQYYDMLWLLVLILVASTVGSLRLKALFIAANILNFLPVNGFLNRIPEFPFEQVWYMTLPLTVAANMVIIVCWIRRLKKNPERGRL